jgi:uncharacterized protein
MPNSSFWREAVQAAVYEAATAGKRAQLEQQEVLYNYHWEHAQATTRVAIRLAELTGADREVVEAAAWLHDVAKADSDDHGRDGAIAARQILARTDYPPAKIDAVAQAIARHVRPKTDEPVEPLEVAVLWDADKLIQLGVTCALHYAVYLIAHGTPTTAELLDQLRCDIEWQEKLVHGLNTPPARAAGRRRMEAFQALCQQGLRELAADDLE